ncbi:hypothetical protein Tco_1355570 [Tanacetum coccineum]
MHISQYYGLTNMLKSWLLQSSSQSPQAYYVTHHPLVIGNDDHYQGEVLCDDQEDSLTTEMMLLARAITQRYSTPTNNHLRTSSNTRNQAIVQADRVDIQSKNVGNSGKFVRRTTVNHEDVAEFQEPRLILGMVLMFNVITLMLNVIMLKTVEAKDASKVEELEELCANVCMMARIQQANCDSDKGPIYDFDFVSEVSDPSMNFINESYLKSDHEQMYYVQPKIIKPIIGDD